MGATDMSVANGRLRLQVAVIRVYHIVLLCGAAEFLLNLIVVLLISEFYCRRLNFDCYFSWVFDFVGFCGEGLPTVC